MNNLLRFNANTTVKHLRAALVEAGRIAYTRGLLTSNDGNLSVRLGSGDILITPSGLCKGRLAPDDILLINAAGDVLHAAGGLKPTSETPMHIEVYRRRPDARAVIHAHPPYAVALTLAGKNLRADILPEIALTLGDVPTTDFALPCSEENAAAIRALIPDHDALILRQHGVLAVGATLDHALIALERVESCAQVQVLAEMMGQVTPLPAAMLPQLHAMRRGS